VKEQSEAKEQDSANSKNMQFSTVEP